MAVPFFLSVLLLLLLLLCQHGSGFKFRSTASDQDPEVGYAEPKSSKGLHCQKNPYTDEGLPCAEVDALEKIISNFGLPEPSTSRNYCSSETDDKSISFECGCNESTTNSWHITSLVSNGRRLSGQIDERLSELTHLNYIDLSDNQLQGTIPESLGKLTRLKTLNLHYNQLSGQIPPTIGNLEALQTLDLQSNFLNDSIPPSLGKLMNLTDLSLSYNMLSGRIPKELGNLSNLTSLSLRENRLSGPLPTELGKLRKLKHLSLYSNNLTGRLPKSFDNLKSLHHFSVSGNKLSGEIPPFIAKFTNLTRLFLMGNDFKGELPPGIFNLSRLRILMVSDLNTSFSFPEIGKLTNMYYLVLRNCSLTGGIPDYIGNKWTALNYLDLSFNNLNGSIPQSLKNAPFLNSLLLTNNKLTGSIPPWILENVTADLSYNNFADPTHHDSTEVKTLDPGKPNMDSILALSKKCTSKHHSLFINCGGARTNAEGKPYDEDISTDGFFSVPGTWAYSCSGDFIPTTRNSSDFVKNMTCGVSGERKLKDLNIIEMAKGPNEAWKTNFTAIVDGNNPLEIHFFWAGKGSLGILNGPLVSAISVTPNFNVHDGKLSASQIAGITIGCAFAPLLLFLFAWKMRLLGNRELREKQIEVQERSFTLQQIIHGTRNFSSKMEIGRGRFGVVYKANLPDQIKLAVKKISPPSEQREKDELKSEIGNLISLSHENLVQLLGGYSNKDLHLLIYEYMETGSLHKALFEQRHTSTETELSWSARFDICLGIAKGLNYLHEEEEKSIKIKIVHGNINAKNILLDKTHTAKLSDFGLATIYNEEDPFTAIKARGSRVYMAPEHALGKAITVKADVYSYGVVVLEIVSGRSNTEYIPNQEADFLLDTAGRLHQQGRFLNLVDKKLGSRFDNKQALTLLHLAMECINQSPTLRPSMSEVVTKLSDIKASAPSSSSEVV
ncbi:LEUCINE-RICH REPEAT-CONTAINING PROTEIN-RELATED [Salix purpurea]|uniref:LEUCINE-RICH REPEAT-CONTAINING PROTEIN-RELATED n=1 Tax=Salix purpurea TaxID=77065 RepID=A0A9Q1A3N6_SALPP|nr:LEUCINE-RICH REPEAT-CONTAINING PROTEIN-RELATED [Salix purpurea]